VLIIPQMVIIWTIGQEGGMRNWIYAFFWLPVAPACAIWIEVTNNTDPRYAMYNMIEPGFLNMPASWLALVLNIFLWMGIYYWLQAIMPTDYGI
jgi:hypothetical protein